MTPSEHDLAAQAAVVAQFTAAMNDDFNTPEAFAVLLIWRNHFTNTKTVTAIWHCNVRG